MSPRILVAVCCRNDVASYTDFYQCLTALSVPDGSEKKLFPGFFPHENKERAVAYCKEHRFDAVFFLDDDFLFPPDVLMRLMHHGKDIITGPSLHRQAPFSPYLFMDRDEEGRVKKAYLPDGNTGVVLVDACGGSGLLIRRKVFDTLPPPYFDTTDKLKTDDLFFSHLVRRAGFMIHCDLSCPFGHILQASVWPEYNAATMKWTTAVLINNTAKLNLPAAKYNEEGTELVIPQEVQRKVVTV